MTARYLGTCCICSRTLGHLWTGRRRRYPDYFCTTCWREHLHDADGNVIPDAEWPEWIRALVRREWAERKRRQRWRKKGYDVEVVPFTSLGLPDHGPGHDWGDLTQGERLESLGKLVRPDP